MIPTRERLQLRPVAQKPEVIDLSGGTPRAPLDFGIKSISGNQITFHGGMVLGFTSVVTVADTTVTCGGTSAEPHLILAQGTISPLTAEIVTASVLASTFTGHSSSLWKRPLATVYLVDGSVVVSRIRWQGAIDLKSWVGP